MADINDHKHEMLIDRYLNNHMDAAEEAAFEVSMIEDQHLFERVEFVGAMKQALISEQDVLQKMTTSGELAPRKPVFTLPFSSWLQQPLSWAASALIVVLGGHTFYQSQLSSVAATPIGSLVLIEGTRSSNTAVFEGPGPYLFQIDAGLGSHAEVFKVTLLDRVDNKVIVEQNALHADNNGWVRILVNDTLSGEYTVELGWQDNHGATQSRTSLVAIKPH